MMSYAELTGDVFEPQDPECRDSHYFLLKCDRQEFLIGLENILECLRFAEKEYVVPELPESWWSTVFTLYPGLEEPVEIDDTE